MQSLQKARKRILPSSHLKKTQPCQHLDFRNPYFQKRKTINLCCFKPLCLWPFVIAVVGH